jgi:ABC-type uncharacterized transport system substrate-binding protein
MRSRFRAYSTGGRTVRLAAPAALLLLLRAAPAPAADVFILKSAETAAWRPSIDALRKAGGGSHTYTEFDLRGDKAEATRVAGTLKGRPGVMVAMGPLAAQAARETIPEAPLVFCMVPDPARLNLAGPGIGGVAFTVPVKNQLAAFRLVNPRGVRVGVLYTEQGTGPLVQDALKSASSVRLSLIAKAVVSVKDLPTTLRGMLQGGEAVDAVWLPPDPVLMDAESRRFLLSETAKAGKPVYASAGNIVAEGALVSNGPDFTSIGELAGELVNRLAGGEKGKMEMLVPRGELVINRKMASKLGIDVSADALKAANRTF